MNTNVPITLADLIRRGSSLDAREAERLAVAWSTEIRLELEQTGISVIRGVGTLTLSAGVVRFQQDPDFPIGSELPAVEGFSEAVAASLHAASTAPPARKRPPVEETTPEPDEALVESLPDKVVTPEDPGTEAPSEPATEDPPSWEELADVEAPMVEEELPEADMPSVVVDEPEEPLHEETAPVAEESAWSAGMEAANSNADARIDEPIAAAPESPRTSRATRSSREPRAYEPGTEGSSRWIMVVGAVVVLVVVAALLYRFVLAPGTDEPPAVASVDSSSVVVEDSVAIDADSSVVASIPEEDTGEPPVQSNQPARTTPLPQAPSSTLDAGNVTAGMGGYTLIVGSTLNANAAERVRSRFTNLGLPTGVLPVTADSTTRYRIAVGHFATASEADTLRIRRASELPDGTWVLSVR